MTGTKLKTQAEPPRENRRLGYARVSTYGQTLDAQLEQLRAERCGRIYVQRGSAFRAAIAASVNQTVRLPRWRKAMS